MANPSTKKKPLQGKLRRRPKKIIELKSVTIASQPRSPQSFYRDEYAREAKKLCQLGATDRDLAEFFEVTTVTIWNWQARHPEFSAALNRAKDAADDRVERSLYSRATGYTFDSEKIFNVDGEIVRVPILEHVPPETTACIFWLKNRRPAEWRDKTDHDHTHAHTLNLQGGNMSVEEAQSMFRQARQLSPAELERGLKVIEGTVVNRS